MRKLLSWVPVWGQIEKRAFVSALVVTLVLLGTAGFLYRAHQRTLILHLRLARVAPGSMARVLREERRQLKQRALILGIGLLLLAAAQALLLPEPQDPPEGSSEGAEGPESSSEAAQDPESSKAAPPLPPTLSPRPDLGRTSPGSKLRKNLPERGVAFTRVRPLKSRSSRKGSHVRL